MIDNLEQFGGSMSQTSYWKLEMVLVRLCPRDRAMMK